MTTIDGRVKDLAGGSGGGRLLCHEEVGCVWSRRTPWRSFIAPLRFSVERAGILAGFGGTAGPQIEEDESVSYWRGEEDGSARVDDKATDLACGVCSGVSYP